MDRNLNGLDLNSMDWSNKILRNVDLSGLDLTGKNMFRITMSRVNLSNTILVNVNLTNAIVSQCNLIGTDLTNSVLLNTMFLLNNLSNTNLTGANLTSTKFDNTDLTNATFNNNHLHDTTFSRVNLTNTNFMDTNLTHIMFSDCNLIDANLTRAYINLQETHNVRLMRENGDERLIVTNDMINYADRNFNYTINNTNLILAYTALHPRVMPPPLPPRNVENLRRIFENNNVNPEGHRGVAYEVHNSYDKFLRIKDEYLSIIEQSDNTEYETKDKLYVFIYDNFEQAIKRLFPEEPKKMDDFDTVFEKFVDGRLRLSKDEMSLIGKSVSFAFSQDDNFKEQYIISFLDETCNAYTGSRDNTSCVKGIKERFVLSVGYVVEIICKTGCDNEIYKKLDKLLNPKFDVAQEASEWFQNKSNNEKLQEAIQESTKKIMITQIISDLIDKAKQMGSYNSVVDSEIHRYINELVSSSTFDDYMDGGRKSRKSRKSRKFKKKSSKKYKKSSKKKSSKKKSKRYTYKR
jgi:hypothetical protein